MPHKEGPANTKGKHKEESTRNIEHRGLIPDVPASLSPEMTKGVKGLI
jgi:hypothetical protein